MFKKLYDNPEKFKNKIKNNAKNFHNSKHKPIKIYDGISRKKRTIIVPTVREQIVHHMVVNILQPIFMKSMYDHSYGSIPGRGVHLAKKRIKKAISKGGKDIKYVLKMDIRKYFDSIPHDVLKAKLSQIIKDDKFLDILFEIIDVTDHGIPLGFYTSQWIANWYLTKLDHYIKEQLHAKYYYRYMDDMIIFGSNKRKLHQIKDAIQEELRKLGLKLKDDWQVFRFENKGKYRFLDFMGFRFYRDRITLRRKIYYKICRKARRLYKKDKITIYDCLQMISYIGWIDSTDTYDAYLKYIKPYINIRYLKKRISNYNKEKRSKNTDSSSKGNEVVGMGFKQGAKARVFKIEKGKGNYYEGKISTSKKINGHWRNDFSGFVRFVGDAKEKAKTLKPIAKIVINECETCREYDSDKKKVYVSFVIFDFDIEQEGIKQKNS